jgi:hypothetical protein
MAGYTCYMVALSCALLIYDVKAQQFEAPKPVIQNRKSTKKRKCQALRRFIGRCTGCLFFRPGCVLTPPELPDSVEFLC